jgi:hypothetical protein
MNTLPVVSRAAAITPSASADDWHRKGDLWPLFTG